MKRDIHHCKIFDGESDIMEQEGVKEILKQEGESMSNPKLKEVIPRGFGIHHAGLTKKIGGVVEDLFAQGHLCSCFYRHFGVGLTFQHTL